MQLTSNQLFNCNFQLSDINITFSFELHVGLSYLFGSLPEVRFLGILHGHAEIKNLSTLKSALKNIMSNHTLQAFSSPGLMLWERNSTVQLKSSRW